MEIILFEYPGCPYCRQAERIIKQLKEEHPEYQNIEITVIDEVNTRRLQISISIIILHVSLRTGQNSMRLIHPGVKER